MLWVYIIIICCIFFYLDKNVINIYIKKKDFINRVFYFFLREVMIFFWIEGDININFVFWFLNKLGIICVINKVYKKDYLVNSFIIIYLSI